MSSRAQEVSLQEENLPETEDWEPVNGEPELALGDIQGAIVKWEEELKVRGRAISGRTMCVLRLSLDSLKLARVGARRRQRWVGALSSVLRERQQMTVGGTRSITLSRRVLLQAQSATGVLQTRTSRGRVSTRARTES